MPHQLTKFSQDCFMPEILIGKFHAVLLHSAETLKNVSQKYHYVANVKNMEFITHNSTEVGLRLGLS